MKSTLKVPVVSEPAWRRLYTAAHEFHRIAPWELLEDSDLFGVQDPETNETGYCCVLGAGEEVFGLAVYRGARGLETYRKMQSGQLGPGNTELLISQDCLQFQLVDREELEEADRKVIRKLGMKLTRRSGYPQFRSYLPGYAAWYLTEREAGFLALCLERATAFALRFQKDSGLLDAPTPESCLVDTRISSAGRDRWELHWRTPARDTASVPAETEASSFDELRLRRLLKSSPKGGARWEADLLVLPHTIEDRERPYFARTALIADRDSGMVVGTEVFPPEISAARALGETVLATIETQRMIPERICLSDADLQTALMPLGQALGTRIVYRPRLHLMSSLKDSLLFSMSIPPDDSLWDEMDDNEMRGLPF